MKILVTGARGFIGGHLMAALKGHDVVGIDRADGDLRHDGVFRHLLWCHNPDVVVHLAAKVGRLFGEDKPADTVLDNVGMTALVAKACGDAGVRLAYASTSEIYGDGGSHPWREPEVGPHRKAAEPHNAYGLTKRQGEEFCQLYTDDPIILRFSMPYGPGLPAGKGRAALINFLHNAYHGEPLTVHKDAERSWCWIGDTVRGVRMILESGRGGAWNIGRDDNALPMRTVAEMACDLVGASHDLIVEVDAPGRQTVVKRLNTDKLRGIGWDPGVELEDGMRMTLAAMNLAVAA